MPLKHLHCSLNNCLKRYHLTLWSHSAKGQHATYTEPQSKPVECCLSALCRRISFPHVTMNYRCMQNIVKFWGFFYISAFRHLKLSSNSFLHTHSLLQKKQKNILQYTIFSPPFFYIRKEKILLAESFRIIYFLVSILILVFEEMLSCRITCNLGIYL